MLPICGSEEEELGLFAVQSIPSPLRAIPEPYWRIGLEFVVPCFILNATHNLLTVVPRHVGALFFSLMRIYSSELPCSIIVRGLSTGQPHSFSFNEGVLRLEAPQYPANREQKTRDLRQIYRHDDLERPQIGWPSVSLELEELMAQPIRAVRTGSMPCFRSSIIATL